MKIARKMMIFVDFHAIVHRRATRKYFSMISFARDLTLNFFSFIDTYYVRIRQNEIELVSKCLNAMNFGCCLASSNSIVKYVQIPTVSELNL